MSIHPMRGTVPGAGQLSRPVGGQKRICYTVGDRLKEVYPVGTDDHSVSSGADQPAFGRWPNGEAEMARPDSDGLVVFFAVGDVFICIEGICLMWE
jgi:hypothetical protein